MSKQRLTKLLIVKLLGVVVLAASLGSAHAAGVMPSPLGVASIPIPAVVWMFGSALGLLGWIKNREVE